MLPPFYLVLLRKICWKAREQKTMVDWTRYVVMAAISIAFCFVIDMSKIPTTLFINNIFVLSLCSMVKMCVTTSNGAMRLILLTMNLTAQENIIGRSYCNLIFLTNYSFSINYSPGCVVLLGIRQ